MAVKAQDFVTLSRVNDGATVQSVTRFYFMTSGSSPAKPTAAIPPAPWQTTEQTFNPANPTDVLYMTDRTNLSNGQFVYSDVTTSAGFMAAKDAYILAQQKADQKWVESRGTDLVTNGTGYLLNNTNFSPLVFDASLAPPGLPGAFRVPTNLLSVQTDEFIPYDPTKKYALRMKARDLVNSNGTIYLGFTCYDIDGKTFARHHVNSRSGTLTTLVSPINPGDTVIHVDSATNWSMALSQIHQVVQAWNYVDSTGRPWPALSFTKNTSVYGTGTENGFAAIDTVNNTITLKKPWPESSGVVPVGTEVSQGMGGDGSGVYRIANAVLPNEWTDFSTDILPEHVLAGTAMIRVLVLTNRGSFSSSVNTQVLSAISMSDASLAIDKAEKAVLSAVDEYATSTSSSTAPTSGWSTTTPSWSTTNFIWRRVKTTYGDGSVSTSAPAVLTGNPGATGSTGKGISSIVEEYYLSTSNTTQTGGSWVSSPPAWVNGRYYWTRTKITYTDSSVVTTDPVNVTGGKGSNGAKGDPGNGVTGAVTTFQASSSGTTVPTGTWLASPPAVTPGNYLWSRTITSYTLSDPTIAYSVAFQGESGEDGLAISSVKNYYRLSVLPPAAPTVLTPPAPWTASEPEYTPGSSNNLFVVTRTVFTDNSFAYSVVSMSASFAAAKAAYLEATSAGADAQQALDDAQEAFNLASDADIKGDQALLGIDQAREDLALEYSTEISESMGEIMLTVSTEYATKDEMVDEVGAVISQIEQNSQNVDIRFLEVSEATVEVEDELTRYKSEVANYIRFSAQGIELGKTGSPFVARLSNSELAFLESGKKVAYVSNNQLHITNAEVKNNLAMGTEETGFFDFIPRPNGNLSFKFRPGSSS